MKSALISAGKILGFLALWTLLLAIVVMSTVTFAGPAWYRSVGWRLWVEIGGALATLAALILMARFVDKRRGAAALGFPLDASIIGLLSGTVMGAAILAAPLVVLLAFGAARIEPDLAVFDANTLGIALVLCFFNVVTQEVLVRSYIFQEIWKKYGALAANVITTLIFVALHAGAIMDGTQGLIAGANVLLASLMLGRAYVRTRALWLPIGIHMGWNALQGPVLGINVTGTEIGFGHWSVFAFPGDPLLTGGAMGVEGGLVGLIGPLLGMALVALYPRGKRE